jgi:photosystem II stability/assembly factor-like uncharacterized protein
MIFRTRVAALASAVGIVAMAATTMSAPAVADSKSRPTLSWEDRETGSDEQFRGLAAVSRKEAWVSGTEGTVLRTTDRGQTWTDVSPGVVDGFDTSVLQFRDIEAWRHGRAVIMAIGDTPDAMRILRTDDGGETWTTTLVNTAPAGFFNCLDFWNARRGLLVGDPVDGTFVIHRTTDGGRTWTQLDAAGMPAALAGEYNFAASGDCLVTAGGKHAYFGTGGADARVFATHDRGDTWTVADSGLRAGPTSGVNALDFRSPRHGVAVGGDFDAAARTDGTDAAARSRNAGATWNVADSALGGYRSGVEFIKRGHGVVAVGITGSDVSWNGGRTWTTFDTGSFDTIDCSKNNGCWASGADGHVAVLKLTRH